MAGRLFLCDILFKALREMNNPRQTEPGSRILRRAFFLFAGGKKPRFWPSRLPCVYQPSMRNPDNPAKPFVQASFAALRRVKTV